MPTPAAPPIATIIHDGRIYIAIDDFINAALNYGHHTLAQQAERWAKELQPNDSKNK